MPELVERNKIYGVVPEATVPVTETGDDEFTVAELKLLSHALVIFAACI